MEKLNELVALANFTDISPNGFDKGKMIAVMPETITAIAEAFQNLENENSELRQQRAGLAKEANDLEAKLAELDKQEVFAVVQESEKGFYVDFQSHVVAGLKLFIRPAPTADLDELVPDKWYFQLTFDIPNLENMTPYQAHGAAWEQCRTATLLKIEDAK